MTERNNKDWKERFDERFVANLPMSGIHLKDSTGNILDYSDIIIGEIKNFIDQIISERDKEIRKEYVDYSTWTCGVCGEENLKGDPTKHKCWKILNDFYNLGKLY